ncbi:MAG: hypothetical protein J6Q22_07070 [Prevotella sp.]|nr:hypothetical protein [Prevotella sp.]
MLSVFSKSTSHILWTAAFMLLPLLATSCQWMTDDGDCESDIRDAAQYINVTISVSASESPFTRSPQGGENGDGREKGIDTRENEVDGVTLIFFQDASNIGINSTAENAASTPIDLAVYYTVTRDDNHAVLHPTGHTDEVYYTTGERQLDVALNPKGEYRLLIVANANLTDNITAGTTTLAEVRDMVLSSVYTGSGIGVAASKFVMSSEQDQTIDLSLSSYDKATNRFTFRLDNVHMERMAARIDYCTVGATYDSDHGGYRYTVGSAGAFLVVTKVTPFNLYDESEFLFKRIRNNWIDATPAITYLGSEGTSNLNYYVVDPQTANKDNGDTGQPVYLSPIAEDMSNGYTQTMSSLSDGQTFTDTNGNNNVIIAYPKENTLMPTSYLKKYATGLAFETKYYAGPSITEPVTRIYYYYLRHQGEKATGSYQAKQWNELSDDETCANDVPMNFGIVRNNIYRVSVEGFTPVEALLKIRIEEKHWRHVDNPAIYI